MAVLITKDQNAIPLMRLPNAQNSNLRMVALDSTTSQRKPICKGGGWRCIEPQSHSSQLNLKL